MRLLFFLLFSILSVVPGALTSPATDKFERYQSISRSAPIDLDDPLFDDLTSKPRDYHAAVILTAAEARFGCVLCREVQPEFDLIAQSWNKGANPDGLKLLFGTLDFSNGKGTFQKLLLQTAPVLLLFPPTVGPNARVDSTPFRFDFNSPVSADQLYTWIKRHLPEGSKPPLVRPVNYSRLISAVTLSMGAVTLFTVLSPYVLPVIRNRNIWAALSLIAILLFTSGHMFNQIRKVPYVVGDGKGGISYFAGNFSMQFGMETQIVAATCESIDWCSLVGVFYRMLTLDVDAVLSFATIALAMKVSHIADAKAQQVAVIIWGVVLLGAYSFLISVFKAKNTGYPFFLPPF